MAAGVAGEQFNYVIMGHVLQVGVGQITAPAGRSPRAGLRGYASVRAALRLTIRA
jgi:hypothetical protein